MHHLVETNCPSYKVYHILTYEILKAVSLTLKFGLWDQPL
jgi:hypothetical protein